MADYEIRVQSKFSGYGSPGCNVMAKSVCETMVIRSGDGVKPLDNGSPAAGGVKCLNLERFKLGAIRRVGGSASQKRIGLPSDAESDGAAP